MPCQPNQTSFAQNSTADWFNADRLTINLLPDDALPRLHTLFCAKSPQQMLTASVRPRPVDNRHAPRGVPPSCPTSFMQNSATIADRCDVGWVTIDILPDDALLEIFDFYVDETKWTNRWHILVHVCTSKELTVGYLTCRVFTYR